MTIARSALATSFAPSLVRSRAAGLSEFLLVGGLTPALLLASWLLRRALDLDTAEYAVGFTMFYAAFVINDPHFAVTYFLFYRGVGERLFGRALPPVQRLRYALAGVAAPLLLMAWAVFALVTRSAPALGLMIQLMFLLVGWHYVKQGFGVMTVLAARRGVRFEPRERLALLAHCYSGWGYAWANPADPGTELEEKGVVYRSIAHSAVLERAALAAVLSTLLAVAWLLFQKWRRERRFPLVTPLTALLCSIWSWSIYSSADPLVRYVIPALHSVQYLYMVHLLKSQEAREREGPPWFETSAAVRLTTLAVSSVVLGWILFHGAPAALDGALVSRRAAPTALGPTPYFAALFVFVNIHHYLMDGVIWRREQPETRHLSEHPDRQGGRVVSPQATDVENPVP